MVSEGPGAVFEEPKVCEPILKGPGPVLESLRRVLERVQPRLVSKGPQRALNRRTLDRYHRALDSWSLSEGPGPGFRVLYIDCSQTQRTLGWSQKDLGSVPEGSERGLRRPWSCL